MQFLDSVVTLETFPEGYGSNTTGFAHISHEWFIARILYTGEKVEGIAFYDDKKDLERDKLEGGTSHGSALVWFTKVE